MGRKAVAGVRGNLYRGGGWYIADFRQKAFIHRASVDPRRYPLDPTRIYIQYAYVKRHAYVYKEISKAQRRALEINAQMGGNIAACSVVTAEAAACLDLIWMRERCAERAKDAGNVG